MTRHISHILALSIAALSLGMAACSSDAPDRGAASEPGWLYPVPSLSQLTPAPGSRSLSRDGESATFTVPDGKNFRPYEDLYPVPINPDFTTIGVFLVKDDVDQVPSPQGAFNYRKDNKWDTTVKIEEGDYFLFGFMPATIDPNTKLSLAKRDGSLTWADGAVLTITDFPAITGADASVVVGVLKAQDSSTPINDPTIIPNLKQGVYSYEGKKKNNFVYLLLDHIYTNVNFEMYTDYDYSQLRTIKLTKVEMKSSVSKNIRMQVELSDDPLHTISALDIESMGAYDPNDPAYAMLFPVGVPTALEVKPEVLAPAVQEYTSVPGYFAPASKDQEFTFIFTYDVYDKKGNKLRRDCVSECKWNLNMAAQNVTVANGISYKIKVRIKPTYLYQLGEPDVDFNIEF